MGPVTRALILANLAVFGLQQLYGDELVALFALWPVGEFLVPPGRRVGFEPWQLLTSAFLHAYALHILTNMFALWMFGREVERTLGSRRFAVLYFAAVVSAALVQLLVVSTMGPAAHPTVGASGGVFGVLLAFAWLHPRWTVVLLLPPVPMPAWLFVTLYAVVELGSGVLGTKSGIAHFAHLGGMLGAFIVLRYWRSQVRQRARLKGGTRPGTTRDWNDLGARELVTCIAHGELRAEDCARAALECERAAHRLNALSWIDESRMIAAAREVDARRARGEPPGMLAGLLFVVKDNIDVAGMPSTAGTPALRDHVARRNAPVVERMIAQGAVCLGKAGMHELGAGATSSNLAMGIVRNPRDRARVPGGSSGGTAAAIAARVALAGLGTDTAGSVRIPAAFTGTAALRPTTFGARLYPAEGVVPLARDLDVIGPMARTVDDVALLHAAITGATLPPPPGPSGLRIGVPRRRYWEHLEGGVAAACESALERLRAAGVVLVDVDASPWFTLASEIYTTLLMHGVRSDLAVYLVASGARVSAGEVIDGVVSRDAKALYQRAADARIAPAQVEKARAAVHEKIVPAYHEAFRAHGIEALIFPTVPVVAPLVNEAGDGPEDVVEIGGRTFSKVLTLIRNTHVTSALGAPGVSQPAGLTREGLPVGLELDGLPGNDAALLGVAMAVERVLGELPPAGVRSGAG